MKNLIPLSLLVGGFIPLLCFGLLNIAQKLLAPRVNISVWIAGIALGGIITGFIYEYFWGKGLSLTMFQKKEFLLTVVVGALLWGVAICTMTYAFTYLKGNASQIFPVVMASGLLTALISVFVLGEPVTVWKIIVGSVLIFAGGLFLL